MNTLINTAKDITEGLFYNHPTAEEFSCVNLREGWSIFMTVKDQMAEV